MSHALPQRAEAPARLALDHGAPARVGAGEAPGAQRSGRERGPSMKLVERMFDNAWYIASREQVPRQEIQEECRRALQSHREAAAALQRARAVSPPSPSAVAVALSHTNSSQAALNRARARAEAAERCTHVVNGHAFNVRDVLGATGAPEVAVASCTLERTATLVPPGDERIWTARLTDPAQRYRGPLSVHLTDDAQESFEMVCRWIVTGHL